MRKSALVRLLQLLEEASLEVWLDGGWGVDALLGQQTRPHKDVDIIVRVADVPRLCRVLAPDGFAVHDGTLPTSFVLANPAGLRVDVHAVVFDAQGNGVYRMQNGEDWVYLAEGFLARGQVAGRCVPCLSPAAQALCHAFGYSPTDKDISDMEWLEKRYAVELPPHLKRSSPARGA